MSESLNENVAESPVVDRIWSKSKTTLPSTTQPTSTDSSSAANVVKVSTIHAVCTKPLDQMHINNFNTSAGSKSLLRKITIIDTKKLQQAGLDRRIAEALNRQKSLIKVVPISNKTQMETTTDSRPEIASKHCEEHEKTTSDKKTEVAQNFGDLSPAERLQHAKKLLYQKLLTKLPTQTATKAATGETGLKIKPITLPTVLPKLPKMFKIVKVETDSQAVKKPSTFAKCIEGPPKSMPIKTPQEIARVLDFTTENSTKTAPRNTSLLNSKIANLSHQGVSHKTDCAEETPYVLQQHQQPSSIKFEKEIQLKPAVPQLEHQQPNTIKVEDEIQLELYLEPAVMQQQQLQQLNTIKVEEEILLEPAVRQQNQEPNTIRVEEEIQLKSFLSGHPQTTSSFRTKKETSYQGKKSVRKQHTGKRKEKPTPQDLQQQKLNSHHSQRQHNLLQKMLKQQQIQQLLDKKKQELQQQQREQREQYLSQHSDVSDNNFNNFLHLYNTQTRKSQTSYTSVSPASSDDDVIPKASIRTAGKAVPAVRKLVSYSKHSRDFPQVSPLKMPFPTTSLPQEAPLPKMSTFKKPYPLQTPRDVSSHPTKMHTKNLIVLEDKVLSQDEKIDLTLFGLGKPKLEPKPGLEPDPVTDNLIELPLPHVRHEVLHLDELPAIGSTVSTDPQQSLVVVNPTQPKKFIVAADKLRMSKEKIAELAKHIKSQAMGKQQLNLEHQENVSLKVSPTNCRKPQADIDPEAVQIDDVAKVANDEKPSHPPLFLGFNNAGPSTLNIKSLQPSSPSDKLKLGAITELPSQSNVGEFEAENIDATQPLSLTSSKEVPKVGSIIQLSSKIFDKGVIDVVSTSLGNNSLDFIPLKSNVLVQPREKIGPLGKLEVPLFSEASSKLPPTPKIMKDTNKFSKILTQPKEINVVDNTEENKLQIVSKTDTEVNTIETVNMNVSVSCVTQPKDINVGDNTDENKLQIVSKTDTEVNTIETVNMNGSASSVTQPKEINVGHNTEENKLQIVSKTDVIKSNTKINTIETVNMKASASSVSHTEATNTTSRAKRRAPSVCIINEASADSTVMSAVEFINELSASTTFNENSLLELSADEQNLKSSFAINFPEMKLDKKWEVVKKSPFKRVVVKQTRSDASEIDATKLLAQLFTNDKYVKCTANCMDKKEADENKIEKIDEIVDMKTTRLENYTSITPLKPKEEQPLQKKIFLGSSKKQANVKLEHLQAQDTEHKLATNQGQQQSLEERQSVKSENEVNIISDITTQKDQSSEKEVKVETSIEIKIIKGDTTEVIGPTFTKKDVNNLQSNVGGKHLSRFKNGTINLVPRKQNFVVENIRGNMKEQNLKLGCEDNSGVSKICHVNNDLETRLQQKSKPDDVENTQQDSENTREKPCLPQIIRNEIPSNQDSLNIKHNALEMVKILDLKDNVVENIRKLPQKATEENHMEGEQRTRNQGIQENSAKLSANISALMESVVKADLVQLAVEKSIQESEEQHTDRNHENPRGTKDYILTKAKPNKWQHLGLTEQREQDTEAAKILVSLLQPPKGEECDKALKIFPVAKIPFKRKSLDVKFEEGSKVGTQNLYLHIEDNKFIEELEKGDVRADGMENSEKMSLNEGVLPMKNDQIVPKSVDQSMFEQNTVGVDSGELPNLNSSIPQIVNLPENNLKDDVGDLKSEVEDFLDKLSTGEVKIIPKIAEIRSETKQPDIIQTKESIKDVKAQDTYGVIAVKEEDQDLKNTSILRAIAENVKNVSILQTTSEFIELVGNTEKNAIEMHCMVRGKSETKEKKCMETAETLMENKVTKRKKSFKESDVNQIEMIPALDFEKKVEAKDESLKKRQTCSFIAFGSSSNESSKDVKVVEIDQNISQSVNTNETQQLTNNDKPIEQIEDFSVPNTLQMTPTEDRKASPPTVCKKLNIELKQITAITQSDFEVTDMEYSTREDSNYYEDTGKEESSQEIVKSKTNRKRLRKTFDDIKKGRRAKITLDETDSDENDNELHRGIMRRCYYEDDSVEFLGFDDILPSVNELEENLNRLISVINANEEECTEKEEKPSAEEGKTIQKNYKPNIGNIKNWLTTETAGQPSISKATKTKVITKVSQKIMPLKKRWELAQHQKPVETDVTDDTSPAHDDDGEKTPIKRKIHELSDEIELHAEEESFKKIKLSAGEEENEQENEIEIQTEYDFAKHREIMELISDASLNDSRTLKLPGETQAITECRIETKLNQLETNFKESPEEECVIARKTLTTESRKRDMSPSCAGSGKASEKVGEFRQKSSVHNETLLPKKRGRKSAISVAAVQNKIEKTEAELKDTSHVILNETSLDETLPKKRGRKPKLNSTLFEDTILPTSTPVKEKTSCKTADVKASGSLNEVARKHGRNPKDRSKGAATKRNLALDVKEESENCKNTVIGLAGEFDNGISNTDHNPSQSKKTDHTNTLSSLAPKTPERKKRGRKAKSSNFKNPEEFTEAQEQKNKEADSNHNTDDQSPTVTSESKELSMGMSEVVVKTHPSTFVSPVTAIVRKKPGRKPKSPSAGTPSITSLSEIVEGTDAANATSSFNPRLLLVRSRDQLDSDERLTETAGKPRAGSYKCGLCLANVTKTQWKAHLSEHYGIGWIHGQTELNVSSRYTVLNTMVKYYKDAKVKALKCRICGSLYRSALGLLLHLETCGLSARELEKNRIECEFCKKKYTRLSYPGHARKCSAQRESVTINDPTHNATSDMMSATEVLNNVGRIKRQSLMKAESKLKAIGQELQSINETEFEPEKHVKYHPPICIADYRQKCSQDLENFGKALCPQKLCNFTCSDFDEMEKHLAKCSLMPKPGHQCTLCKTVKVFETHELALEHVKKLHTPRRQLRDFEGDSSDCKIDSESSSDEGSSGVNSDEDDVMEEITEVDDSAGFMKRSKKKKNIKKDATHSFMRVLGNKKQLYPPRSPHSRSNVIQKWEQFTKQNYSDDMLFNYGATTYTLHETHSDSFKKCLPCQQNSMKFALSKEQKINKTFGMPESMDWSQLQRFETISVKNDNFAFIGAPIKAIAWAPLPEETKAVQFLAIAYRKGVEKFTRSLNPKRSPTLILIYEINTKKTSPKIQLHYALWIPNGPVHCLDFLPSGGYAPAENRLGLLAVGTAASDIRIYSLPLKVEHDDTKGTDLDKKEEPSLPQLLKVIDLKPVFVLTLDLNTLCEEDMRDDGEVDAAPITVQCTRIKWSEARGHNYIFAGYSNGFVSVWDINGDDNDNLNRFMVNAVQHFVPINYFFTGERGVRDIVLHYDTTGLRWLAVSSYVRKLVVYDLRDLTNPLILCDQMAKNIISSLDWPIMWENFSMAMGAAIPNNGECVLLRSPMCVNFVHCKIDQMPCGVNQVRYNPWQNVYVSATENGDILFHGMRELHYEVIQKTSSIWKAVTTLDVKCLSGSQLPTRSDKTSSSLKMFEADYRDKYGLVFNPITKLSADVSVAYKSKDRVPPHHILRYMRVNCLSCNLNVGAEKLVAYGFENGFLRVLNFKRSDYFN